jgi:chromosomal replication initiation ATPase DnaA
MADVAVTDCKSAKEVHAQMRRVIERKRAREQQLLRRMTEPEMTFLDAAQLDGLIEDRAADAQLDAADKFPTLRQIVKTVCKLAELPPSALISNNRTAGVVGPRHVSMLLCRMLTPHPVAQIARFHGNRDHTTALYAIGRLQPIRAALTAELTESDPLELWVKRALALYQALRAAPLPDPVV